MELLGFIISGILLIGFFYAVKTDFSGYPDSFKEYRENLEKED